MDQREADKEMGGWELGVSIIGGGNGESRLRGIWKYITRRHNTVAHYIATRTILDLYERSARRPGARVSWRWWEQAGLDLEGAKKRVSESAAESDGEETIGEEE